MSAGDISVFTKIDSRYLCIHKDSFEIIAVFTKIEREREREELHSKGKNKKTCAFAQYLFFTLNNKNSPMELAFNFLLISGTHTTNSDASES